MTVDPFTNDLLTPSQAALLLGRPVHPMTMRRWSERGVRGTRLDAIRVGRRWYTTKEALSRFVSASSEPARDYAPGSAA